MTKDGAPQTAHIEQSLSAPTGRPHRLIQLEQDAEPRRSERLRTQKASSVSRVGDPQLRARAGELEKQQIAFPLSGHSIKQPPQPGDGLDSPLAARREQASPARVRNRAAHQKAANLDAPKAYPIEHWRTEGNWPKEYFCQDPRLVPSIEGEHWLKKLHEQDMGGIDPLEGKEGLERAKALFARDGSAGTSTPPDQDSEIKDTISYVSMSFEHLLLEKSVHLDQDNDGPCMQSLAQCQRLLEAEQPVLEPSLFSDATFDATCRAARTMSELHVTTMITPLLVPSPQPLAIFGADHLAHLAVSHNGRWNNSRPLVLPRPQPDFAVGFSRLSFTQEQLSKLKSFAGGLKDTSYFMGTSEMLFPFLTCEVKGAGASLDVADRQNALSTALTVRGTFLLFKLVEREKDIDRHILAFSISHDTQAVRIYGHYPVIEGDKVSFYRHPIRRYYFTHPGGEAKWTAYKFTRNIYDLWMPWHLKRLCSIIDMLPTNLGLGLSEHSELQLQESDVHGSVGQESVPGDKKRDTSVVSEAALEAFMFPSAKRLKVSDMPAWGLAQT